VTRNSGRAKGRPQQGKSEPDEKRAEAVLISLRRIIRATDLHSRHLSMVSGMTIPQIVALQATRDLGEVTLGKLAEHMSLSLSTATTIFDRLERRGLVERYRSAADRRVVHARLTRDGRKVLRRAPALLHDRFIERFSTLGAADQDRIVDTLHEVAEMMGADELDAAPVLDVGPLVENDPGKTKK
jgi:DNA-binding MarR family transcriptional regulator